MQVLVEVDTLDVDDYCAAHAAATAAEPSLAARRLAEDHRAFLRDLAATSHLRRRHVYLALAGRAAARRARARPTVAAPTGRHGRPPRRTAERARRDLGDRCADWEHRLRAAGIDARRLGDAELAGLLYRLLCPGLATRQPLPGNLTDLAVGPVQAPAHQRRGRRRSGERPVAGGRAAGGPWLPRPRDRLAPGAAEETPDWLRVDDRYAVTLAITGYPRQVAADWLRRLLLAGLSLRLAFHLTPIDGAVAKRQLEARRGRLGGSQAMAARQGYAERARERIAEQDIDQLEELIELDAERLLAGSVYATVQAESLPGARRRRQGAGAPARRLRPAQHPPAPRAARAASAPPCRWRSTSPTARRT